MFKISAMTRNSNTPNSENSKPKNVRFSYSKECLLPWFYFHCSGNGKRNNPYTGLSQWVKPDLMEIFYSETSTELKNQAIAIKSQFFTGINL